MGDFDEDFAALTKKPLKLAKDKARTQVAGTSAEQLAELAGDPSKDPKIIMITSTKAEESFKKKQDEIAEQRILKKASKTHKQRVEEFNKHLDSLSEHYDIPKVSWTK